VLVMSVSTRRCMVGVERAVTLLPSFASRHRHTATGHATPLCCTLTVPPQPLPLPSTLNRSRWSAHRFIHNERNRHFPSAASSVPLFNDDGSRHGSHDASVSPSWPPSTDTIYGLASGLGHGGISAARTSNDGGSGAAVGVAIIRISGPLALPTLHALTRRHQPIKARAATRVNLIDPRWASEQVLDVFERYRRVGELGNGVSASTSSSASPPSDRLLDSGILALSFPAPSSFTGEDVVELHVHGTSLIVSSVFQALERINTILARHLHGIDDEVENDSSDPSTLSRLSAMLSTPPMIRPSTAGEFTRRAFLHGKLDLTQVEALSDLLTASTDRQREQALTQMEGALGQLYEQWRTDLLHALAYIEAILDFGDEEADVAEAEVVSIVLPKVSALSQSMEQHLADRRRGEIVRSGVGIVLLGAPNAGKSTLLNALSQRDVAIVSNVPGTTRDVVEQRLNIGGWPCILADTAGIRRMRARQAKEEEETDTVAEKLTGHDRLEVEGMKRTRLRARDADIKLLLLDGSVLLAGNGMHEERGIDEDVLKLIDEDTIIVWSKMDLVPIPADMVSTSEGGIVTPTASSAPSVTSAGRARLAASHFFYARSRDDFPSEHLAHFQSLAHKSKAYRQVMARTRHHVFVACGAGEEAEWVRGTAADSQDATMINQQHLPQSRKGLQHLLALIEQQIKRTVGIGGTGTDADGVDTRIDNKLASTSSPTRFQSSSASSSSSSSLPLISRARHRQHVSACISFLRLFDRYMCSNGGNGVDGAGTGTGTGADLVLAAEQLRLAARELGKLTGRIEVEQLLDVIFQDFCIGK